jgi:hypothetical protein
MGLLDRWRKKLKDSAAELQAAINDGEDALPALAARHVEAELAYETLILDGDAAKRNAAETAMLAAEREVKDLVAALKALRHRHAEAVTREARTEMEKIAAQARQSVDRSIEIIKEAAPLAKRLLELAQEMQGQTAAFRHANLLLSEAGFKDLKVRGVWAVAADNGFVGINANTAIPLGFPEGVAHQRQYWEKLVEAAQALRR